MREIKFRAWNGEKWVFGSYATDNEDYHAILSPINIDEMSNTPVERDSIGQFTGLKDQDGADIYEGDLIKATSRERPSESAAIFKVHYDQVYGSFVGHVVKNIFPVFSPSNWPIGELRFDAKVIGNIYETPELLEVK